MSDVRIERVEASTYDEIASEVARARAKFPGNKHLLAALTEEVGELAAAFLQDDAEEIRKEAIQVACVAVRIFEESDSVFDVKDWNTAK